MSNPYARIFYNDFKERFLKPENKSDDFVVPAKFQRFLDNMNKIFQKSEDDKQFNINPKGYKIEAKDFADFVLSLGATMFASAGKIPNLNEKDSRSPEIIEFFESVKNFCIQNSTKLSEDFDYEFFKLNSSTGKLELMEDLPNVQKKGIFFFGVNRSSFNNMDDVNCFFKKATKDIFDNEAFLGSDIYSVALPKCFPEEIAMSTILKTIENSEYINSYDRFFVEEYWSSYIGKDLEFDENGSVIGGKAYSQEVLQENLKNLKVFGYCAGAANAHRCLKALKNIAGQLYDEKFLAKAWKNIKVVSYAFPLEQEKIDYDCVSVMSNDKNPDNPETVILTLFPSQYHKLCIKDENAVKITDEENCKYVALELPKEVSKIDTQGRRFSCAIDNRNGHRLQNATAKNDTSHNFEAVCYILKCCMNNEPVNNGKLCRIAQNLSAADLCSYKLGNQKSS